MITVPYANGTTLKRRHLNGIPHLAIYLNRQANLSAPYEALAFNR